MIDVQKITQIMIYMNHGDYEHCRRMLTMYAYVAESTIQSTSLQS